MSNQNIVDDKCFLFKHPVRSFPLVLRRQSSSLLITSTPPNSGTAIVFHCIHLFLFWGPIFGTPWGGKHSFHGNITETHIDKRIGAAALL